MLHEDGTVHFSNLKEMGRSPAHYRVSCVDPPDPTLAMRLGTILHRKVLGGPLVVYPGGSRRGKEWDNFVALHRHPDHPTPAREIVTQAEVERAAPMADALLASPLAAPFLVGRHEVPLRWEMLGLPFSTRGVDVVGDGFIVDLKSARNADPRRFGREAIWMGYHAQLALYVDACKANGIDAREAFLVAVESSPPYAVTVFRLTPRALEQGRACIRLWLEQLVACRAANAWPAYAQSVVDLDTDEALQLVGLEDDEEDAA